MHSSQQQEYWNRVATQKTFTHPVDITMLQRHLQPHSRIVDYGCGYGRVVKELQDSGFTDVSGFDTSAGLVARAHQSGIAGVTAVSDITALPVADNSVDCFLLFAVLTCIPSNAEQEKVISVLHSKLRSRGMLYISDYYLQKDRTEVGDYKALDGNMENYGVFTLPEGATFRHHTPQWIAHLLTQFTIVNESVVPVRTMNGHFSDAFQIQAVKPG